MGPAGTAGGVGEIPASRRGGVRLTFRHAEKSSRRALPGVLLPGRQDVLVCDPGASAVQCNRVGDMKFFETFRIVGLVMAVAGIAAVCIFHNPWGIFGGIFLIVAG